MGEVLNGEVLDRAERVVARSHARKTAPEGCALGLTDAHRHDPRKVWADAIDRYIRMTTSPLGQPGFVSPTPAELFTLRTSGA